MNLSLHLNKKKRAGEFQHFYNIYKHILHKKICNNVIINGNRETAVTRAIAVNGVIIGRDSSVSHIDSPSLGARANSPAHRSVRLFHF